MFRKLLCKIGFHCRSKYAVYYFYGKEFDVCKFCGKPLEPKQSK